MLRAWSGGYRTVPMGAEQGEGGPRVLLHVAVGVQVSFGKEASQFYTGPRTSKRCMQPPG